MSNGNSARDKALANLANDQATIVSSLSSLFGGLAGVDPEPDSAWC